MKGFISTEEKQKCGIAYETENTADASFSIRIASKYFGQGFNRVSLDINSQFSSA